MTRTIGLDSSVAVVWLLQRRGWQQVQSLIDRSDVDLVLPGPALAESIWVSRAQGTAATGRQIAATLTAVGMTVRPAGAPDLVRAAELVEVSRDLPDPQSPAGPVPLSLGDALVLAVTERLGCPVITRDRAWREFAERGLTTATVHLL